MDLLNFRATHHGEWLQLAEKIGISQPYLNMIAHKEREPHPDVMLKLLLECKGLVHPDALRPETARLLKEIHRLGYFRKWFGNRQ